MSRVFSSSSSIEPLEPRIAPATITLSSTGRAATWLDHDGDAVTLQWTAGAAPDFITIDRAPVKNGAVLVTTMFPSKMKLTCVRRLDRRRTFDLPESRSGSNFLPRMGTNIHEWRGRIREYSRDSWSEEQESPTHGLTLRPFPGSRPLRTAVEGTPALPETGDEAECAHEHHHRHFGSGCGRHRASAAAGELRHGKVKVEAKLEAAEAEQTKAVPGRWKGFGALKGKIWMAADFHAPLEDFRESME